ncbi:MAG: dockerin type I repeat-containing protein [Muribaculaceae bacterium]|nr:dockerin type I repeat-containing protein [Muribaculaceae bacterium]
MKKILTLLFVLVAATGTNNASNYFTLRTDFATPVNDTIRIDPSFANTFCKFYAMSHFEGYLDHWYLMMSYPNDMTVYNETYNPDPFVEVITRGPEMKIPYINSGGTVDTCHASLLILTLNAYLTDTTKTTIFSSTITDRGYWDPNNDGNYECYGTVKWCNGYHDYMFFFNMFIPYGKLHADITLDAALSSTDDWRGVPTVTMPQALKTIHVKVGFKKGDVNGDGIVDSYDMTVLTDWLLYGFGDASVYQIAASDVNENGVVDLNDLTALIDLLLALEE